MWFKVTMSASHVYYKYTPVLKFKYLVNVQSLYRIYRCCCTFEIYYSAVIHL